MKKQIVAFLGLCVLATACGGTIPSPYRGKFRDGATGTLLTLEKNAGTFQSADGRTLKTGAENLEFDNLLKAQSGIYVVEDARDERHLEVYWISPDPASRKEEASFVWYSAEIMYGVFDKKQEDDVQYFGLTHCRNGLVQLDMPSKLWQVGCPENATYYELKRMKE